MLHRLRPSKEKKITILLEYVTLILIYFGLVLIAVFSVLISKGEW